MAAHNSKPPHTDSSGFGRHFAVPLAAAFLVLLLGALLVTQQTYIGLAKERDLARVQRYVELSKNVFEARFPQTDVESILAQLRQSGLDTIEFLPLNEKPAYPSPRYAMPVLRAEAWCVVHNPASEPVGILRIARVDDSTALALKFLRIAFFVAVLIFAVLLGMAWSIFRRRVAQRAALLAKRLTSTAPVDSNDPLDQLQSAITNRFNELDKEENKRQTLLDHHSEAACAGSTDGRLHEVNAAYCRIFNKTRDELVGSNYLDLIPPSDRTDALNSLRQLSRRHPINVIEHRVVLPDGTVRWMRWRDQAVFDEGDEVVEVLSFGTDITAEKNLETRLTALQLAFDQMQSLARTGSLTWDFSADRMDWTEETFRLLELDRETTTPSLARLLESVVPEDREPLRQLFERARENGDPFEHEFRATLPDGSRRVLQSRAEVRADPKTKLLDQLTCTLRDITSLRDAESATRRELRLREAIEQSLAAGIVVSDDKGRNLLVNPAFCEMTGWSSEELVGATAPYPYWPEEEVPEINKAFALAIEGKTPPQGFELRFRRKDGSRFDVLIKVAPLLDSEDHQLGWLGAVTDISSIQQTRRELQTINERLRIAQDVAEFGIWDWDPVEDTLHWDRQSFALFGHPEATDAEEVWRSIHSEDEQQRLTYELQRLIAAGGTSGQDRIRARWPDGTIHDLLSTYVILRDNSGRATRVLGINRDITSELEEERELRNANERLAAALEGGSFGTFEHIIGVGDVNWSPANYEINGIDPSITDPGALFEAWRQCTGSFFPELMTRMNALPVHENHLTYEFSAHPPAQEPRRVRVSVFIERNKQGHPTRLVGITRRVD